MPVHHEIIELQTEARPTFHDVTAEVKSAVKKSSISNGIVVVYSQHTTCSVVIQEEAHDTTFQGTKYLMQDMLNILDKIAPRCKHEGQYLHPGPAHIQHATQNLGEEAWWSLNTDAHLRSCMIGRSETIPLVDETMQLGEFGEIYFIDFDGTRPRPRKVHIQIVGE